MHSTTQIIAKELVKTIAELTNTGIVVDEYAGHHTHIEECTGCIQCFISGNCVMDLKLLECARGVIRYVLEGDIPRSDKLQKKVFRMNNRKYMELEAYQDDIAEVRKWFEHDYISYEDYDDVIEMLYKNQNKAECL